MPFFSKGYTDETDRGPCEGNPPPYTHLGVWVPLDMHVGLREKRKLNSYRSQLDLSNCFLRNQHPSPERSLSQNQRSFPCLQGYHDHHKNFIHLALVLHHPPCKVFIDLERDRLSSSRTNGTTNSSTSAVWYGFPPLSSQISTPHFLWNERTNVVFIKRVVPLYKRLFRARYLLR